MSWAFAPEEQADAPMFAALAGQRSSEWASSIHRISPIWHGFCKESSERTAVRCAGKGSEAAMGEPNAQNLANMTWVFASKDQVNARCSQCWQGQ